MISAFTISGIPSREKNQKATSFGVNQTCVAPLIIASVAPVPDIAGGRFPQIRTLPKIVKFIARQVAISTIGVDRLA